MKEFVINAQRRAEIGTGACRRLRHTGFIPAVIYGAGKEPVHLTLTHKEVLRNVQQEAFFSHIITVNIDGNLVEKAVVKDLQRHSWRPTVLHVDFQRISETEKLSKKIPLHFLHEDACIGVKLGGGIISHHLAEVEIRCLPKDLPEYIEVDLTDLNLNGVIHLSNLALPTGVEIVALAHDAAEHDLPVVSVHLPRGSRAEEEQVPTEATGESATPAE
jgi:large subunit ribosomal protein L25